ncbi:MAG: hydrogenase expression/formation protein HypE [Chitinispirillia bacterium]
MDNEIITSAHGGGGTSTKNLIENIILQHLSNPVLDTLDDGACIKVPGNDLVFTTDSFVVDPVFFPGGDIGKLAVCGTVNDLAMQGAEPIYLSMGLIIQEGFPLLDLDKIIRSAALVLNELGISVVTGDTKVINRSKEGGIYINTAGIGVSVPGIDVHAANARPGDTVIITGTLGDHGMAIMSKRNGLRFDSAIESDTAPLWPLIRLLTEAGIGSGIHVLRDPTRGGVAAALCDISRTSGTGIIINEPLLPIKDEVRGACDLLGMDPLNVANEGKALILCPERVSERVLQIIRSHPQGKEARVIGEVVSEHTGTVLLKTLIGGQRIVDMPGGEDLPRIC